MNAQQWLRARGNAAKVRRLVKRLTGRDLDRSTTSRWSRGQQGMTAPAEALVALLIERPELLGMSPNGGGNDDGQATAGRKRPHDRILPTDRAR